MPTITKKYEKSPNVWNLSIVITLGGIVWTALAFYITTELNAHSASPESHPMVIGQLQEIRSDQLKEQIMKMDERLCDDTRNKYYRKELVNLITKWERLNKPQKFPTQLLTCGK